MKTTQLWRRVALTSVGLVALTLAACGDDQDSNGPLTVYSGRNESLLQPLVDQFEEATGHQVEVRYGSSAEMAAAILEEGSATPADVFYSQEVGAVGALDTAGRLAPLPPDVVSLVDERFRPSEGTNWVGVTGRSRVIVYRPDLVETAPTGVLDLVDPRYAGQVAWVPSNAGFQAFITAFRVSRGEEAARQWLEQMIDNGAKTYEGNVDVLEAVNRGEMAIGLINHYYWVQMAVELGGFDMMDAQLIFPKGDDPGALVNATAVGVLAGAADDPVALEFVKFLLSNAGQTYFATEVYEYPLVDGVADPEGVPALEDLEGPRLDLSDLESLEVTQQLLADVGLLS
jgi:iron(III) transport system substrate-binding protein